MATAIRADLGAGGTDPPPVGPGPPHRPGSRAGRWVLHAAVLLVVVQLAVRTWVVWGGSFHDDDLTLAGRSALLPLWSAEYLLYDHGGHFMPGTYVVAGLLTRWAPLEWGPAAVSVVLLQALASVAVLRLLRVLLGDRPALLLPLTFYLFSPLTLPSFAWWAAALNALPLQAGLAWVIADAVLLTRTGRRRYAVSGVFAFALALVMFEKAVVVPWVAFGVVVLLGRSAARPIRTALRRGAALWLGALAVTGAWAGVYLSVVGSPAGGTPASWELALTTAGRGITEGLLPPLIGGPWHWERSVIFAPWATPPLALSVAAVAAAVAGVLVSSVRRRGAWLVWLLVAGYVATSLLAMVTVRLSAEMADILPGTLRYVADTAVVLAVAFSLVLLSPAREARTAGPVSPPKATRVLVPVAALAAVSGCLWSSVTFQRVWTDTATDDYLATARASLAAAGDAPLLDDQVPGYVRWEMAHPENLASRILAPLPDRPRFARSTPDLRVLDASGRLLPGRLQEPYARVEPGTEPGCGHRLTDDDPVTLGTGGDVMLWRYTVRLDYTADRDATVDVTLGRGETIRAPVQQGTHRVYVRLTTGGDGIRLSSPTPGLSLCVHHAAVGQWEVGREPE